ncbi:MAG TPA: RIP metalloprotease RseP [Hyphomicrobiaceae bacterium]|nr:RIP metalloprotease RseP [Hyphomicrobiaceae bacterium]
MMTFIAFVGLLTIVVFIHELGHFLVARWCGVKVQAFSIGFGREIFGFDDRHGTRWRFAWIPLGGYVKFIDDANEASVPARSGTGTDAAVDWTKVEGSFQGRPLGQRAAIVAAGPIANFILSTLVFTGILMTVGERVKDARISRVVPGSVAESAGFKPGDVITAVNGTRIETFNDLVKIVGQSAEYELTFTIDRGGAPVTLKATPRFSEEADTFGGKIRVGKIGVAPMEGDFNQRSYPFFESLKRGAWQTWEVVPGTFNYLKDIVTRRQSADQLGGPVRIAEVSGRMAKAGFVPWLYTLALISAAIGLFNLFPIPLLDGGHLLYNAYEAVMRRPLSEQAQEFGFKIGASVVLTLMLFVMWNDRGILQKWLTFGG